MMQTDLTNCLNTYLMHVLISLLCMCVNIRAPYPVLETMLMCDTVLF